MSPIWRIHFAYGYKESSNCINNFMYIDTHCSYFDGLEFEELSYNDPFTLGINIVWTLVIAWIIWDLLKGKDIKLTLALVGSIMLISWVYEFIEFGFGLSQAFYSIELLMFVFAYIMVRTEASRTWYALKDL